MHCPGTAEIPSKKEKIIPWFCGLGANVCAPGGPIRPHSEPIGVNHEQLTDLQRQKLTHHFRLLDADGNGVIEAVDFNRVVEALARLRRWSISHPRYRDLLLTNRVMWRALTRFCDINEDARVTLEEWLDFHCNAIYYEREMTLQMPDFAATLGALAKFFYELLDRDGDGTVTRDDYLEFCSAHGLPAERASSRFELFDRDADGVLSREEVFELVDEFYRSDDAEAPGNQFFGMF